MGSRATIKLFGLIVIFTISSYHLYTSVGSYISSPTSNISLQEANTGFSFVVVPVEATGNGPCYLNVPCEYELQLVFLDNTTNNAVEWSHLVFSTIVTSDTTVSAGHLQYIQDSTRDGKYLVRFTPRSQGLHEIKLRLLYSNRETALHPSDPALTPNGGTNNKYLGLLSSNGLMTVTVMATDESGKNVQERLMTALCSSDNTTTSTGHWIIPSVSGRQCVGASVFSDNGQFDTTACEIYNRPCTPHWRVADCEYPLLSNDLVHTCLSRWNVYLFGDSVTRQMVSSLGDLFPNAVHELQKNETMLHLWEGYSNPRKMEFPKLFNVTARDELLTLIKDKSWRSDRDVVVFNAGLHDVAFSTMEEYAAYLPIVLESMIEANFSHLIFRLTTAIHPHVVPGGPIAKHWRFTTVRIEEINKIALEVIEALNQRNLDTNKTQIAIINADQMTASRPDAVLYHDMRHYCPTLMIEMWSVLFHKICGS